MTAQQEKERERLINKVAIGTAMKSEETRLNELSRMRVDELRGTLVEEHWDIEELKRMR